jgi:Heparinase II/III-like protein/Heparinase II/III N-terminus
MERLSWYLKRLSIMDMREVPHRLREHVWIFRLRRQQNRLDRANSARAEDEAVGRCMGQTEPQLPALPWDFSPTQEETDALLKGEAAALGFRWRWRDDPAVWHTGPDSRRLWPKTFFADISYRLGNPFGDVRLIWEPSRLQQLIPLALLAAREPSEITVAAANLLEHQLRSWFSANPPFRGVHYISAMECGLRVIAVCHALDLARGALNDPGRSWTAGIRIVGTHAPFIFRRLSLHSSAGNHTIAECAALVYAGTLFPEIPESAVWRRRGLAILEQEAERQILPDGGGIEQAIWYHRFVVDLLDLVVRLLMHRDEAVPERLSGAVERGRRFLAAFPGLDALPPFGDSDGGYALSPHLALDSGSAAQQANTFEDSGYTVMPVDTASSTRVIFDHGGLGMAPAYGHGHADALSVSLYQADRALLLDTGTLTYTGNAQWRRYFRSTPAHNTVTVDEQDQARQETPFQWSNPYTCAMVRHEETDGPTHMILARHDGYAALGVTHWRGIACRDGAWTIVWDHLDGDEDHTVDLHWHCDDVEVDGDGYRLQAADPPVSFKIEGAPVQRFHASENPRLGWIAPIYGRYRGVTTLRSRYTGSLPHHFLTVIGVGGVLPDQTTIEKTVSQLERWVRDAASD